MSSIKVRDTAHWHEIRRKHIGGSEIAALYGVSNFTTPWQLHMIKAGQLEEVDLDDNERVREGKFFEPAIAALAQEKFGVTLRKVRRYLVVNDCPGMGSTLDYEMVHPADGLIPSEIKWSLFGNDDWQFEGDEITDAPLSYLLQLQAQLACHGSAPYGQLIAFVGGRVRRGIFERRPDLIADMKARVTEFWGRIARHDAPEPDFDRDGPEIARLASTRSLGLLDLSDDIPTQRAIDDYLDAKAEVKEATERADAAQAELIHKILEGSKELGLNTDAEPCGALIGKHRVSLPLIKAKPATLITPEMVGTEYGGRKAYRRMSVSEIKEAKAPATTGFFIPLRYGA